MSANAGRGQRLLDLLDLLETRTATSVTKVMWARPLRISTYVGAADLPDDLVISVLCLVVVHEVIVGCTTTDGWVHLARGLTDCGGGPRSDRRS
jgi:hypothetical protein